jgi:DivIVA domain-containing protein
LALDRQDIQRRDFPIGRRGYEPEAVDAHLRALADEVEALRQSQRRAPAESLATTAAEQVRTIVEAAEKSAAQIERQAEDEAREIRESAAHDAEQTRSGAAAQAQQHVASVSEATSVMLQRVDAMESELGALIESLRTGANRLTSDLSLLQGNMGELRAASVASESAGAAAAETPVADQLATEQTVLDEPVAEQAPVEDVAVDQPAVEQQPFGEEPVPEDVPAGETAIAEADAPVAAPDEPITEESPAAAGDDAEGARLIALNMALNGTPRDETDRYLAENFNLDDRETLLDEVYARVG